MTRLIFGGRARAAWTMCCLSLASSSMAQSVLHVDDSAAGANDGSTWCDAYVFLQDAITAAADSSGAVTEIRIAQGVYRPDRGVGQISGDRRSTFQLSSGLLINGGYAGCGADNADQRSIHEFETILSGDLAGNDGSNVTSQDENSYHVVTGTGTDASSVLDGLTVTGGHADGPELDGRGGGLLIFGGSTTVRHCTFRGNAAVLGGAINSENGSPALTDSVFRGNSAGFSGGAIRGWQSGMVVQNCLFVENTAEAGGGMWFGASTPSLTHCTFSANSAAEGNAIAFDSCCPQQPSVLNVTNSIFWDGGSEIANADGSTITFFYSDIRDGWSGIGNINADPLFVPGPAGCYYLSQTAVGQPSDSPCVDAGSEPAVNFDFGGKTTRTDEGVDTGMVDMGFHFPTTGRTLVMGDFDRNEKVDLHDIARFQVCFTATGPTDVAPCCRIFDFEWDADVDLEDAHAFQLAITNP